MPATARSTRSVLLCARDAVRLFAPTFIEAATEARITISMRITSIVRQHPILLYITEGFVHDRLIDVQGCKLSSHDS
jgi:hypothetical protein